MLYNIYRPKSFKDVIGQPAAFVLKNTIRLDRVPHSILMSGTRGVGKTTLARIYAKALNCLSEKDEKPCGKCKSCKSKDHPDIYEMDSTVHGNPSGILILQQRMSLIPNFKRKVFILDEAHTITKKGMDVLLKTVEEPSSKAVIILLTTEPEKLQDTLRSRCMQLPLSSLPKEALIRLLAKVCAAEGIRASKTALYKLAHYANGSPRDSLSLLETVRGYEKITGSLIDKVIGHRVDTAKFIELLESDNPASAMEELVTLCYFYEPRFVAESIIAGLIEDTKRLVVEGGQKDEIEKRLRWAGKFRRAKEETSRAFMPQLGLELAVAEITLLDNDTDSEQTAVVSKPISVDSLGDNWISLIKTVSRLDKSLHDQLKKLKFIRVKGGKCIIVKTMDDSYDESFSDRILDSIKKFVNNAELTLEVL